jgi:xanthine dehydrogenase molybdopterin-binding subunit B
MEYPVFNVSINDFTGAMASSAQVISGEISLGTQHHFHMETHVSIGFV